jgi:hypothetical protein
VLALERLATFGFNALDFQCAGTIVAAIGCFIDDAKTTFTYLPF